MRRGHVCCGANRVEYDMEAGKAIFPPLLHRLAVRFALTRDTMTITYLS
jgi:hypothetical protein